jgi:hypothetical protein
MINARFYRRGRPVNVVTVKRRSALTSPIANAPSVLPKLPSDDDLVQPARSSSTGGALVPPPPKASTATNGPVPFHPLADLFPLLDGARMQELAQDIATHGLLDPIVLYEGHILDGRCRDVACRKSGVAPRHETYEGTDPVGFVVSQNLHRRQLNDTQRSIVGARISNVPVGANQHVNLGVPTGKAAQMLAISRRSIARAKYVLANGDAETLKAVEDGSLSLSTAEARCRQAKRAGTTTRAISLSTDGDPPAATNFDSDDQAKGSIADKSEPEGQLTSDVESSLAISPISNDLVPVPGVRIILSAGGNLANLVALKIVAAASRGEWPFIQNSRQLVWMSGLADCATAVQKRFVAANGAACALEVLAPETDDFGFSQARLVRRSAPSPSRCFRRIQILASGYRLSFAISRQLGEVNRFAN